MKKISALILALVMVVSASLSVSAQEPADPLASWRPAFDPSGAQFTYILSNVSHPAIDGIGVGFRIRDKVWERSEGRLYVDFRPLAQLGGERDVLQKLRLGAVQGMMSSSVAAANLSDQLGVVNLPFVVDTFDKLDKFRDTPELWEPFRDSALRQGVMVADITGYGPYGWATTTPVRSLEEAARVNFRIAEAPVNTDIYRAWGLRFTVMPWPDVPQALQTGVINGLDHTPIVCSLTRKFEIAKSFTEVNYAQGLFVHLINKRWFDRLPADLQEILLETIAEESAGSRDATRRQHEEQIAAAKAAGVEFYSLSDEERARLIELAAPVFERWGARMGADYLEKVRTTLEP
ncbi:TRAP transporter substrate-binding protein [Geoalkalibacter halelectricus]|uniref:TRAP transporter substrate-binding protein DctP n=1 Tax=Geoalkalibacter halelectricus TaxID=2847045 RepID=A0ABY5ZNF0_9BACT|nr:TRAP transporter substrate-binding protein [Geoalkalibacter halelectricus]MDO3378419.1 TRAP transporter substrate-binding protein DctP [Geoalkalibacter halelectricus]UWZ80261.1 TRAP transporter substrate-binding protein DctP [Geoalkalibacter halelectricus]